jgi:hypothetical protein
MVAAAMAALILMPQRFLYSMAVAGASVAVLPSLIAILVVPSLPLLRGLRQYFVYIPAGIIPSGISTRKQLTWRAR